MGLLVGAAAKDGVVLGADRRIGSRIDGSGPYLDDRVRLRPYGDRAVIGYCGGMYAAPGVTMDAFLDSFERRYGTDADAASLPYLLHVHFRESGCDSRDARCMVGGVGPRGGFCFVAAAGLLSGRVDGGCGAAACEGASSIAEAVLGARPKARSVEDAARICLAALRASAIGYGSGRDCPVGGRLDVYVIRTGGRRGWLSGAGSAPEDLRASMDGAPGFLDLLPVPSGVLDDLDGDFLDDVPGGVPDDLPDDLLEDFLDDVPGDAPDGPPGDVPGDFADDFLDDLEDLLEDEDRWNGDDRRYS